MDREKPSDEHPRVPGAGPERGKKAAQGPDGKVTGSGAGAGRAGDAEDYDSDLNRGELQPE